MLFLLWKTVRKTDADVFPAVLLSACFCFATFRFKAFGFSALFLSADLLYTLELHIFRTFRLPFSCVADLVLSVTAETNAVEIFSYPKLLNADERILLCLTFILCIPSAFFRPANTPFLKKAAVCLLYFAGLFPSFIHPAFYWAESRFSADKKIAAERRKNHSFRAASSKRSPQNVLFLIGESHRFQEFNAAFPAEKFKNMILFENYISVHHHTTPALQSLLTRKKLHHGEGGFYEKSLFSLFAEAGYDTYFLSYLKKKDGSQSAFSDEANHFINYAKGKKPDDADLLPALKNVLAKRGKKLIVVKMIGAHFNFEDRYPPSFDRFRPSMQSSKLPFTAENKNALMNTYKNAVAYSADIIKRIAETAENIPESTLMSFSSDHGLCIYDKELYILPDCKNAFHIPWFLTFNEAFAEQVSPERLETLRSRRHVPLTAEYVFETVVSLSGIKYPDADERFDASSNAAVLNAPRKVKALPLIPVLYENL